MSYAPCGCFIGAWNSILPPPTCNYHRANPQYPYGVSPPVTDHPHTSNTADTADLVRRLSHFDGNRLIVDAINEIERLTAIVAAVDALVDDYRSDPDGPDYAYMWLDDIHRLIHPKDNR